MHDVTDRDRDLVAVDQDDELPEFINGDRSTHDDVVRAFDTNELAQCREGATVLVTHAHLPFSTVERGASGLELFEHDVE